MTFNRRQFLQMTGSTVTGLGLSLGLTQGDRITLLELIFCNCGQ
jgi:hypothetical protein